MGWPTVIVPLCSRRIFSNVSAIFYDDRHVYCPLGEFHQFLLGLLDSVCLYAKAAE